MEGAVNIHRRWPIVLLACLAAATPYAAVSLIELGGSASGGGVSSTAGTDSSKVQIALDASGNPSVAWVETSESAWSVYLKRWNPGAGQWEELGGSASGLGLNDPATPRAWPAALKVDSAGNP